MTRDDITRMAREAGVLSGYESELFQRFADLVAAAEREAIAKWMIDRGYATGHGDTIEDLLKELEWQIAEREREACAKVCDGMDHNGVMIAADCAAAIRARGN